MTLPLVYFSASSLNLSEPLPLGVSGATTWLNLMTIGAWAVAGPARACRLRGLAVRPFKPQNMSNNAAVVAGGGEIGRAQAVQARAAGVAPSVHMNPVLLKPETDIGAQVIVQGRRVGTLKARDYRNRETSLLPIVLESF